MAGSGRMVYRRETPRSYPPRDQRRRPKWDDHGPASRLVLTHRRRKFFDWHVSLDWLLRALAREEARIGTFFLGKGSTKV
jgi:hypothetical protein